MGMRMEVTLRGVDGCFSLGGIGSGYLLFLIASSEIFKGIMIKLWYGQLNLRHLQPFERVVPGHFFHESVQGLF